MSAFLKFQGKSYTIPADSDIADHISGFFSQLSIDQTKLSFQKEGKVLPNFNNIRSLDTIVAIIPLLGGKGGYGAKLKNQGGKKVRPNDNKFSRDAQGRRIQYQMAQKQYTEFIKKKMQEDEKVNIQREKFRVMQQTMKDGQSFMKLDKKYNKELEETQNKLAESIRIGRQRLMEKKMKQLEAKMLEKKKQLELYQLKNQQQKNEDQEDQQQKRQNSQNCEDQLPQKRESAERLTGKGEQQEMEQIRKIQQTVKKVKTQSVSQAEIKSQKIQVGISKQSSINQIKLNPVLEKPNLMSAKDKLKSLFKK